MLLTPSALECCDAPGDFLRLEIEEALDTRRNIVPLMLEGFDFQTPTIASKLTGKLEVLNRYNAMTVLGEYFAYSAESGRRFRVNPATCRSPATQGLSGLS